MVTNSDVGKALGVQTRRVVARDTWWDDAARIDQDGSTEMNGRQRAATNTMRKLWAECMGYCMNPECENDLLPDANSIGEAAHIKPDSEGGSVHFNNLILLCPNCHTKVDGGRTERTVPMLREWKKERGKEIRRKFVRRFSSFDELKDSVIPILNRNGQIFANYGPAASNDSARRALWLKFEEELIANNSRLELLLVTNGKLLHGQNQNIVDDFVAHAREFVETREEDAIQRLNLFPTELLSIFGLKECIYDKPVPDVSPLQNFITDLMNEHRFYDLQLEPVPILYFAGEDRMEALDLRDWPNVKQIYWSGRYYRPRTTDLDLSSLIFFLKWLSRNRTGYEFIDVRNLTELILNRKHKAKICYKYCLSLSDLHEIEIEDGLIVVNLYTWNGGCITDDAREFASQVGLGVFTQDEFFIHARKNIKWK